MHARATPRMYFCVEVVRIYHLLFLVFFYHDQHQPVNFFAKERLGFSLIVNMTHLFLTFLSRFACIYAGSFGKSDD